jgi:tetratricopeptide (TPR) repeat protein
MTIGGEVLQWWLAWLVLAGCVLALTAVFIRLVYRAQNPVAPALILAALHPLYLFWGYFKADVHHNIAIYFSKERNWDAALSQYFIVNKLSPDFVMAPYFMGNVYNDRFNMQKAYRPEWGDTNNVPRDDYERALDAYERVRRLSPNYVQMHHQVGALHMKRAQWAVDHGHPEEGPVYLEKALNRFRMYEQIDPVFPPNYFRMGQIYMIEKRFAEAAKAYEDAIKAEKCAVDPGLISTPFLRSTILAYQDYVSEPGIPYPVHRHESAEAYTNLANAYFLLDRLEDSEQAFRRALALEPNNELAKRNLNALYHKADVMHRLRRVPPAAAGPGRLMFTGYEIFAAKK